MDPLTHTLVGLMLNRAGFDRIVPRSAPLLVLAANSPDCDVVTGIFGSLTYLDAHRHFTHGVVFAPILGALCVAGIRLATRNPIPWLRGILIATFAVLTHLVLDWTNVYGVRLLAPFSGTWFRLDITNVVDAWIWTVLFLAIAAPFLSSLVGSEIGAKSKPGRGWAIFALLAILAYDGARFVLHQRAIEILESRIYDDGAPLRVAAVPSVANPWAWTGLVDGNTSWSVHPLSLWQEFDPSAGRVFPKPDSSRALDAARSSDTFQHFLNFAQWAAWRVTPVDVPERGFRVEASDLRFALPSERRFAAIATVDATGRVVESLFTFGPFRASHSD